MADGRREPKSKYTADRGMPGAFEGETVTRRRMMTLTAHGAPLSSSRQIRREDQQPLLHGEQQFPLLR